MALPIIALLTDFGEKDYFVAALKAVILSINAEAQIIDISHEVSSFDRREAAFLLWATTPYFSEGTIFLVVVDPGVGSQRKIILAKGTKHFFIGPDNGVLVPALKSEGFLEVRQLSAEKYFLPSVSSTFESRDKMAPVAAWLSRGVACDQFGPIIKKWEELSFPEALILKNEIRAEILHVDKFGNLITNIRGHDFENWIKLRKNFPLFLITGHERRVAQYVETFASGHLNRALILGGSSGYIEIAWREASAAQKMKLKAGRKIRIKLGR